jgi:catecholate siderophore receptor
VSIQVSSAAAVGFTRRRIAIAVSLALAAAASSVTAQNAPTQTATEPKTLSKISVEGSDEPSPKADRVESPKFTQPLVDTPQTIVVVTKEILNQQGATTLSHALRNTPGVTFLLGENGNTATGDSIFMRGFDTQGSIYIDGIRDLGSVTRDTFNTEQVEIAKGPSGPDYGRGAASGYVNLASKVPTAEDFTAGTASYGTSENARVTGDVNHAVSENTALRLNVMYQDGEVEGRDFVERKGWAVAPSVAFGLGGDTRSYFYLLHTEQDNVPDGGISTIGVDGFFDPDFQTGGGAAGVIPDRVARDTFYGYRDDFEEISGTMFTARFEHDFSDNVTIRNTTRYGRLEQFYVLTGVNAVNALDPNPANWTVNRTRQSKFQENKIMTNQTNLTLNVATGSVGHAITAGVEFIDEEQFAPTYSAASLGALEPAPVYGPPLADAPLGYAPARNGGFARGETQTIGAYVFDTVDFAEKWQVTGGVRFDNFDTDFESVTASTTTPVVLTPAQFQVDDTLFSYKIGVLYKPATNGSIYLSHAISQQPPGGSNFTLVGGTGNNLNRADLEPTEGSNLEVGTKWEFRDGALAVTAAIFDSQNKNELVPDPVTPAIFIQIGEREVKGVELGIVGRLTDNWDVSAGISKLDTEITRGSATQQGAAINWSPELTFSSWTSYRLPFGLTIGGGARYVDQVARSVTNQPVNLANTPSAPEYWVVDAMLGYQVNDQIAIQLNGYNLLDEDYIAQLNNGGSRYIPGTQRSALLSVNFRF